MPDNERENSCEINLVRENSYLSFTKMTDSYNKCELLTSSVNQQDDFCLFGVFQENCLYLSTNI